MKYQIVKNKKEDIPALADIYCRSFQKEPWNEFWNKDQARKRLTLLSQMETSLLFSFYEEETLIGGCSGFVLPYQKENQFQLYEFFVDIKFQGRHLGSLFLNKMEEELKGVDRIILHTKGDLLSFYSKNGFCLNQFKELEKKI